MPFDHKKATELCDRKFRTRQLAADAAGVQRTYLARLLAGRVPNPELKQIERVAAACGCKIAKLIKEAESAI